MGGPLGRTLGAGQGVPWGPGVPGKEFKRKQGEFMGNWGRGRNWVWNRGPLGGKRLKAWGLPPGGLWGPALGVGN